MGVEMRGGLIENARTHLLTLLMVDMMVPAEPRAELKASRLGPARPRENAPINKEKKTYEENKCTRSSDHESADTLFHE